MRTFAQKPKATQPTTSTKSTISGRGHLGRGQEVNSTLHLQRTIGNHAVERMLQTNAEELEVGLATMASPRFAHDFSQISLHPKSPANVQTKLTVGSPGDIYEQEADRISERVMRMPDPQLQPACPCGGGCPKCQTRQPSQQPQTLQTRRTQANGKGQTPAPPIVHEALTRSGQPLDCSVRDVLEPSFGHDFSQVRIHTDAKAAESSHALSALAYTVGQNIMFNAGMYQPHTSAGRHLLAHELSHTIQQKGTGPTVQRAMKFEFQTKNVVLRTKGKKREKLPRKFGPTKKPKHSRFLHKGSKGKPAKGAEEGTAIELQSEAGGFVEFETPSWHRDWCAIKKPILEAVNMVDKIKHSSVVSTTGGVNTVKFPFDVKHLKKSKAFKKGLKTGESLEVQILDPSWTATIQASESFELSQFESYLTEHISDKKSAALIISLANGILLDANPKKIPDKDLVNLRNFLQIILEHLITARINNLKIKKRGKLGRHLAKEYIALMSRTNFSSIFQTLLSGDEQKLFERIVKSNAIPKSLFLRPSFLIFPKGFVGHESPGPNIDEWLVSIHNKNRDLLSSLGGDNRALGRFPVDTRKGKKHSNLVKLEARGTTGHNQNRPVSEWVAFTEEVFKAAATKRSRTGSTELIYDPKKCP